MPDSMISQKTTQVVCFYRKTHISADICLQVGTLMIVQEENMTAVGKLNC